MSSSSESQYAAAGACAIGSLDWAVAALDSGRDLDLDLLVRDLHARLRTLCPDAPTD